MGKNSILFKFIFIMAVMFAYFGASLSAAEEKVNHETACSTNTNIPSEGGGTDNVGADMALWVCPSLPNMPTNIKYNSIISSIDFFSGTYSCDYVYANDSKYITSCRYKSSTYEDKMKTAIESIAGSRDTGKMEPISGKVFSGEAIDINTDINIYGFSRSDRDISDFNLLEPKINEVIESLKVLKISEGNNAGALFKVNTALDDIRLVSYKHLIEPYVNPNNVDIVPKDNNFALFLAGLVTLDPDIVQGYNKESGKMNISPQWKTKAQVVSAEVEDLEDGVLDTIANGAVAVVEHVSWMVGGTKPVESQDVKEQYMLNISSWIDVFEMKLWGWFYHLNQRLDLGYDIISTQLLAIMLVWFMLAAGTTSGVNYILNKDGVQQQVQPAIIKTLTTLLAVGAFYVSMATPISPQSYTSAQEQPADFPQEMQKNRTMMKWLIRYSASEGSKMATMLSDLALDSFLTFIVKKQQVYSGYEMRQAYASDLARIAYHFPASQIVQECRSLYKKSDIDFINSMDSAGFNINPDYSQSSGFLTNANAYKISYNACMSAYKIVMTTASEIAAATEETKQRIKQVDAIMAKSVVFLIQNNILLQDKMGWINSFTVPVSYFMMKEYDMFLSPSIDEDKIEEEAEKFNKAMSYKSKDDVSIVKDGASSTVVERVLTTAEVVWNNGADDMAKGLSWATSYVSKMMLFNVLPGYSSIRSGIYEYLSSVYGDWHRANLAKKQKLSLNIDIPITPVGVFKKILGKVMDMIGDGGKSALMRAGILLLSFLLAYFMWKFSFIIMFISSIAIMILLKIVLYFKDLLIHTFISIFIVVWAFSSQQNGGAKMKNYLKDTLILMMYPSMIVISTYIFIFSYELFNTLYLFIMKTMLANQAANVSLMALGNSDTVSTGAYFTLYMMGDFAELLIYVFSLVLAYTTIIQLPELILKKMGLQDSSISNVAQSTEKMVGKGEKTINPLMQ